MRDRRSGSSTIFTPKLSMLLHWRKIMYKKIWKYSLIKEERTKIWNMNVALFFICFYFLSMFNAFCIQQGKRCKIIIKGWMEMKGNERKSTDFCSWCGKYGKTFLLIFYYNSYNLHLSSFEFSFLKLTLFIHISIYIGLFLSLQFSSTYVSSTYQETN